ncbi:butyrate kinase [Bacteroides luti]|uniref:Probable butyrate kinase n=1 Tax=Bacteroides luti TaxID=1297750 RepID=A0A1M4YSV0_9BACE|nr:butyrate kinase [Bacteroides luti]SHF08788.1 butyrate kinase [Bacteroides luti]
MRILAINPGSTSTKIAVYDNENRLFVTTFYHSPEALSHFPTILSQYDYRKELIIDELKKENLFSDFAAIVGRGGLLKPIASGVYEVNEAMKNDLRNATMQHACNLGGLLAEDIALLIPGCKAYIADPVVVDELEDVARLSGSPLMMRKSVFHALNHKAIARKYARSVNKKYEELDLIVAHLGGGISVAAHRQGRVIDVNNALEGSGPFSPERAGTLPARQLVDLCFSGDYTQEEIKKMITGRGGLMAHLGTTDAQNVVKRINEGDARAELVLKSMIYNIAKEIGAMSVVLHGKIDAILLTGGISYNDYCINKLKEYIAFIAPVYVFPGEDEMEALAFNALGVLRGKLNCKEYY